MIKPKLKDMLRNFYNDLSEIRHEADRLQVYNNQIRRINKEAIEILEVQGKEIYLAPMKVSQALNKLKEIDNLEY